MNIRTIAKTLGIATAFAISLTACSNNAPAPQPASNGGTVSGSTTSTSDAAACINRDISGNFRLASTGRVDGYLTITNGTTKPCTLTLDYPRIEFTGREGTPLEGITYTQGATPTGTVTLGPGEQASSDIEWQMDGTDCAGMAWALNLSVDGKSAPKSVDPEGGQTFSVCGHEVQVGGWNKA